MRYVNNDAIVYCAMHGVDAANRRQFATFSVDNYRPEFGRYGAPYYGYLPERLRRILDDGFRQGRIRTVVYSYSTPIAWLDGDTWIYPDVRYSATTSIRHQSKLWRLSPVRIPADCGIDEYSAYLTGRSVYSPGYSGKLGTVRAGAVS